MFFNKATFPLCQWNLVLGEKEHSIPRDTFEISLGELTATSDVTKTVPSSGHYGLEHPVPWDESLHLSTPAWQRGKDGKERLKGREPLSGICHLN